MYSLTTVNASASGRRGDRSGARSENGTAGRGRPLARLHASSHLRQPTHKVVSTRHAACPAARVSGSGGADRAWVVPATAVTAAVERNLLRVCDIGTSKGGSRSVAEGVRGGRLREDTGCSVRVAAGAV